MVTTTQCKNAAGALHVVRAINTPGTVMLEYQYKSVHKRLQ